MKNKSHIKKVNCRRVFDSRGNPTIEVEIITENDSFGKAISPSGASTGTNEVIEVRDNDNMFGGKDVKKALEIINKKIAPNLIGLSCEDQNGFDNTLISLDKSVLKENIGGNVTTALSIANYLCASNFNAEHTFIYHSESNKFFIPKPEIQIFGGGAHANKNNTFQDFLIYPIVDLSCEDYFDSVYNITNTIKKKLVNNQNFFGYCDEGGLYPNNLDQFQICDIINESIIENKIIPGKEIGISIDVAASNFHSNGIYTLYDKELDSKELTNIFDILINKFNVSLIEDPYDENDISSFIALKNQYGLLISIIGDDLICTNYSLLENAIQKKAIDGLIVKINQCGTISETLKTIKLAKENNIKTILSARSGDTEENFLSHLAVAWQSDMIKVGSFARGERTSKWNELVRIEEKINKI